MESLRYVQEFGLILCTAPSCQHAVWPTGIRRHFQQPQHQLPTDALVALEQWAEQLPYTAKDTIELRLPNVLSQPLPHLPLHEDGVRCQLTERCHYVCRS